MPDVTELGIRITLKDGQIVAQQITAIGDAGERTAQRVVQSSSAIEAAIARQADAARRYQESIERQTAALAQNTTGQEGLRAAQQQWLSQLPVTTAAQQAQTDATRLSSQEIATATTRYQAMIAAQEGVTAATITQTAATNSAFTGFGRIRQGLTSLIARYTGTIPVLDRIGGQFLAMGAGGTIAIAVIAGIAAIALAYRYFTQDAKAAEKQAKETRLEFEKIAHMDTRGQGEAASLLYSGDPNGTTNAQIASLKELERQKADFAARVQEGTGNNREGLFTQTQDAKDASEALKKVNEELERRNKLLASVTGPGGSLTRAGTKQAADDLPGFTTDAKRAADEAGKEEGRRRKRAEDAAQRLREKVAAEKDAVDKMVAGFAEEAAASGRMLGATVLGTEAAKVQAREEEVRLAMAATGLTQGDAVYDQVEKSIRQALANKETIKAITDARDKDAEAAKRAGEAAQKLTEKTAEIAKEVVRANQHLSSSIEHDLLGALQKFTTGGITSLASFFKEFESLSIRMVEQFDSAMKRLNDTLAAALKAGVNTSSLEGEIKRVEQLREVTGIAASGFAGATAGYGVGASTQGNRGSAALFGTAAGAASGAMIGSVVPGVGTAIGAAVGAIAGFVGGIVGAGHAASLSEQEMKKLQETLTTSIKDLRAQLANDALGSALAQVQAQFVALRKAAEDAYATGQNEAQRKVVLADLTKLEAQRLQQVRDEFALKQSMLQQDAQVLLMRSTGRTAEADALAFQLQQERVLRDLRKQGATDETLAAVAFAQAAELAKRNADALRQAMYGLEDLNVRIMNATGQGRAGSDAAFRNQQQREYQGAIDAGRSPDYLKLLTQAQIDEAIQRATQQRIADQTQAINDGNARQQAFLDAQLKTAQDALKVNQQALQTAQQSAVELRRTSDILIAYGESLKVGSLSTLSPVQRLQEAKSQMEAVFALAKGGDAKAGAAFGQSANTFLGESRGYNASSAAYGSDFASVQAMTDQLKNQFGTQATVAEQQLAQLQKINATLNAEIQAINDAKAAANANAAAQIGALTSIPMKLDDAFLNWIDKHPGWGQGSDPLPPMRSVATTATSAALAAGVADAMKPMIERQDTVIAALQAGVEVNQVGLKEVINRLDKLTEQASTDASKTHRVIEGLTLA